MNDQVKMTVWGRELELGVTYDCYSDEEILEAQREAVKDFVKATEAINQALSSVVEYCLKRDGGKIGSNKIENIFRYVAPKYLYVVREEKKHVVAIMCNYRFDTENGVAIVFEDEKFLKIGTQDSIL